jgi:predicted GH43/DUF377 family glycosyl hydrolase
MKIRVSSCTFILLFLLCKQLNAQVIWEKYSGNPVVPEWSGNVDDPSGYKYAFEPTVLYDSITSLYRMWFISLVYGYGTSFVVSSGLSLDGKDWYLHARNPVFRDGGDGSWEKQINAPKVVKKDNQYRMYYSGWNNGKYQIGLATSSDGKTWQRYTDNPVLQPGPAGAWDSSGVGYFDVLLKDTTYYMWYNGHNGTRWTGIGLATSTDGIHWTKHGTSPAFQAGIGWENDHVGNPTVVYVDGIFYMVYLGHAATGRYSFGWAYSSDGINWTRGSSNPIITLGSDWEGTDIGTADMIFHDGKFHLWYSGLSSITNHWQIGLATSNYVAVGIDESHFRVPSAYKLYQSYPNPFNPETIIKYDVPKESHVTLKIYDLLGQEVTTLIDEQNSPGTYSIVWHAQKFSSGVYWYRLKAGSYEEVKKMTLIR